MSKKYDEMGEVLSQEMIAKDIYSMWIRTTAIANVTKAGQFISVYTNDTGKCLPRPISVCEVDMKNKCIRIVYRVTGEHTGTKQFSQMQTGEKIHILGPLGNGFPLLQNKTAILIGGGIGVPPMLELAKHLDGDTQFVLGFRDEVFLTEECNQYGNVYIATEDGNQGTKGTVLNAIQENELKADVIYACGPTPMLRAIQKYATDNSIECYLSLEEKMACGIGACLACVCKSKEKDAYTNVHNKRVCKEGPVFLATEVEL
jgi:2-polyprenylphenol hydroxylase and related flavodoxin oxidoreductases